LEESQESLLNELLVLNNTKDQLQVELEELIKTKTKADLRQADLERMAQSGGSLKVILFSYTLFNVFILILFRIY
jgi:hypothetical protein